MRIGFDLDNTIINYEKSYSHYFSKKKFVKKNDIKKILFKKKLVKSWQSLQEKVYSKGLNQASCYPGVINFLYFLEKNKINFYIVSHKTKKPYTGKKIDLRAYAKSWIKKNIQTKVNIPDKNIFFEETKEDKIKRIKSLKLDYFIDDLDIILQKLPDNMFKLLFNPNVLEKTSKKKIIFSNWNDLYKIIFKKNNHQFKDGVNNHVELLEVGKNKYIYKKFDIIKRKRSFLKEKSFLKIANLYKLNEIPHVFHHGHDFIIMSYLNGKKTSIIDKKLIIQSINFIKKINQKKIIKDLKKNNIGWASDSCKNLNDTFLTVNKRIKLLKNGIYNNIYKKKIIDYLNEKIIITWKEIEKDLLKYKKETKILFKKKNIIFSPSDFGLHNMKINKNKFSFFDFEYSGFDNIFKLVADFISHPDHLISKKNEVLFTKSIFRKLINRKLSEKEFFLFNKIVKLHKIKWCLVILNGFLRNKKKIREFAGYKLNNKYYRNSFLKSKIYYKKNFTIHAKN